MANTSAGHIGLSRLDAGWLYLLAGAAVVSAMVLIGPADDLVQLRYRRDRLAALESDAVAKLRAYETFLEAIDDADPMLVRRLAAAQLNLVPGSVKPIGLVGADLDAHVDDWINETLPSPTEVLPPVVKDSWLRRLAEGPTRLWAMLAGVVLIFIGLLPQTDAAASEIESTNDEAGASLPHQDELKGSAQWEDELPHEGEAPQDADDDEDVYEEIGDYDDADLVEPALAQRQVITESGKLLGADDTDDDEHEPLVQVVTISASTAP